MNAIPHRNSGKKLIKAAAASRLADANKAGPGVTKFVFIEEVHRRAETITPLLKEMLEFRPPPHWH
jgi:hypothetical protein